MQTDSFISEILSDNKKILTKNEELVYSNHQIKNKLNRLKESLASHDTLRNQLLQKKLASQLISKSIHK